MKRKLFLSAISSLPFIGYLFPKKKKEVIKIQFTTKTPEAETGKIYFQFDDNSIIELKGNFTYIQYLNFGNEYFFERYMITNCGFHQFRASDNLNNLFSFDGEFKLIL